MKTFLLLLFLLQIFVFFLISVIDKGEGLLLGELTACSPDCTAEPVWGCPLWCSGAASACSRQPHDVLRLQGGAAGKIPECMKGNFQPKC